MRSTLLVIFFAEETGIGTVTITFKGNYSGTKTLTYKIKGIPAPEPEAQEVEAGE